MTVLWCGGEDIDFSQGSTPTVATSASTFRSAYARCSLYLISANSTSSRSIAFAGGPVTSCWFHCMWNIQSNFGSTPSVGLGLTSASQVAIAVGSSTASSTRFALWKYSGGTWSQLAAETGNSLAASSLNQVDVQISNFGASATVNCYLNGNLLIAYSGSTTVTGVTALDCFGIVGGGGMEWPISECIVTDNVDTRSFSLQTFKPNAAGTTNNWDAGNYSNINPVSINDASFASVNSTGKDLQAALPAVATGTWEVIATKVVARAEVTAGAVPTKVKLGYNIGGTVSVDAGHTLSSAFATYERAIDQTNPVSTVAWTTSDLGSLQLDLESA